MHGLTADHWNSTAETIARREIEARRAGHPSKDQRPSLDPVLTLQWSTYTRTILPLACLFSASLILANIAYVYLSVSFVQILKASRTRTSAMYAR